MIYTESKIIVKNGTASIDNNIIIYRGDREVEIKFNIIDSKFKFDSTKGNIIDKTQASFGQLAVALPDGTDLFTEIVATENGVVTFNITGEMIDEIHEVGFYDFHIRLYDDNKTSRITLPPVMNGIEIREPLIIEGDVEGTDTVGEAIVGYSNVQTYGVEVEIFDESGNYIPTSWGVGDIITAEKLNKIEKGIHGVDQKIASAGSGSGGKDGVGIESIEYYYRASRLANIVSTENVSTTSTNNYAWPRYVYYDENKNFLGFNGPTNEKNSVTIDTIRSLDTSGKAAYFRISINIPVIFNISDNTPFTQDLCGFDTSGNLNSNTQHTYINNYFAFSDMNDNTIISWVCNDEEWTTTVQTTTTTKKYLWNYIKITLTDGTISKTDPCAIGVYGDGLNMRISVNNNTYTANEGVLSLPSYLTIPSNKVVTFLGDSITYGYDGTDASLVERTYPKIVKELLGMEVNNYGISGSTIGGGGTETTITGSTPMNIRYNDMLTSDYVIVFGGVNDFCASAVPLGEKGDETNQTFYGSLKILIEGLINKYPAGRIGFITPLRKQNDTTPNSHNSVLKDYRDAIIAMCEDYCIPVLDLYTKGGCHPNNTTWRTQNLPDGLHPNQAYYELLAKQIASFILSL